MSVVPDPEFFGCFKTMSPNGHRGEKSPLAFTYVYGRFTDLKIGDVVRLPWVNRYQHGATMIIDKINKKSIKCTEIKSSYGKGTKWIIGIRDRNLQIASEYMPTERLQALGDRWGENGFMYIPDDHYNKACGF